MGEAKNRKHEIENLKMRNNVAFKLRKELKPFINHIEETLEEGSTKFGGVGCKFKFSDEHVILSFGAAKNEALNFLNNVPSYKIHSLLTNEKFVSHMIDHFADFFERHFGHKALEGNCVNMEIIACSQLTACAMFETINRMTKAA